MPEAKIAFITEILSGIGPSGGLELSPLATDGLLAILREVNDAMASRLAALEASAKIQAREGREF